MSAATLINRTRTQEGWQCTYEHRSEICNCTMRFAAFVPPAAEQHRVPAVYWLSGLTCTEENFSLKSGAQAHAAKLGLALIIPDTSPRGLGLPGEDDDWDFGTGAGFYLDATEAPWAAHYNMSSYVVEELPAIVNAELPVIPDARSISGHSMGGHGALTIGLKHPELYRSISALAPICAPASSPWGQKAFNAYLGGDRNAWEQYDASVLARRQPSSHTLLVDQGEADEWFDIELRTPDLVAACEASGQAMTLNMRPGYDHGFYFVASFMSQHLGFHAEALRS